MFDSLNPPNDLAAARSRLQAAVEAAVAGRPVGAIGPDPDPGRTEPTGPQSDPQAGDRPRADGRLVRLGPPGPGWRRIDPEVRVVVADMVLWSASPTDHSSLGTALGPGQCLLFLEPTAEVGWRRSVHRLGRPVWRAALGHHFETDVPMALRSAGLTLTDIARFELGPGRTRSYVLGRAVPARR